ncbi:hypothetical protein JDV02_006090 [Purpureocillium takamizusanense]|uniref:Uncharacterized protein n=1 Tax=Purpureocillium takamizusanense TaxID=2060973 RepID=A0A9Q8QHQ4_9HYPO|nr:uncharacterized protein JDV02_006090 [Purpureocillium takamizusanense]UNI19948.1 hypothetical protein JDV02_006090 [Purpureocillium takamizusanense]
MSLSLSILVQLAWHATAALMAESAIAFLAYSSVFGRDETPAVALYMTAVWSFMLNVYLAVALLMHDLHGAKIKIRHPRQTLLVGLHAFTAAIIFVNIIVRSLYEAGVSTEGDMRRWTLFAAIYMEATIGVFHFILAMCACVGYGELPRSGRGRLAGRCPEPASSHGYDPPPYRV